ncbi:4Fe-4S single cluster domain of Ferredoxin I [Candidatus Tiddalikarchaeum anstoanum]|nr:4Fe-4S single cluster domain of Ferredoxin I [Candidatus Tiddalikarchaeum anstoanum]
MVEQNFKVSILRANCISCGNCWGTCPKVFEQNNEDYHSEIVKDYRVKDNPGEGIVPKKVTCVKDAEANCPVQIIHVK